jgi:hypothetical protein
MLNQKLLSKIVFSLMRKDLQSQIKKGASHEN